jgi:hyperosmotically inducible protein
MDAKRTRTLVAVLALSLAGAGAAQAKSDAWITTKVKSSLATHKNVSAFKTNVDTKDGVVTLRGTARTASEKELAARYAREVDGVRQVNNLIEIKGETDRGDYKAEDRAREDSRFEGAGDRALDRTENAADRAADKTENAADRAGDRAEGLGDEAVNSVGDAALTTRVKASLAGHKGVSAIHTDVDSDRGHVRLTGTADSAAERDLAEKVVRGVRGVKSVDNDIKVRGD